MTIPVEAGAPEGADTMAGYRNAGSRAIRIDMLERLADMLRGEDSRAGFEAKADMLSITGMTLDQFADLMGGLGYKAEKGERAKVKAVDTVTPKDGSHKMMGAEADTTVPEEIVGDIAADDAPDKPVMDVAAEQPAGGIIEGAQTPPPADTPADVAAMPADGIAPVASETPETPEVSDHIPDTVAEETAIGTAPDAEIAGAEMEAFYTFTWGRAPRGAAGPRRDAGEKPRGKGKGKPPAKGRKGPPRGEAAGKSQNFSARPPKKEKAIDPDNPFAAALMGLKDNK